MLTMIAPRIRKAKRNERADKQKRAANDLESSDYVNITAGKEHSQKVAR